MQTWPSTCRLGPCLAVTRGNFYLKMLFIRLEENLLKWDTRLDSLFSSFHSKILSAVNLAWGFTQKFNITCIQNVPTRVGGRGLLYFNLISLNCEVHAISNLGKDWSKVRRHRGSFIINSRLGFQIYLEVDFRTWCLFDFNFLLKNRRFWFTFFTSTIK